MNKKLLVVGCLLATTLLSACGPNLANFTSGQDTRFAKPSNLGPKIEVTKEMIAGREYHVTSENFSNWVKVGTNGFASGGRLGDPEPKEPAARWWISNGNLCLKGTNWWPRKGNCMEFYGGAILDEARIVRPTYAQGPNAYFPVSFMR